MPCFASFLSSGFEMFFGKAPKRIAVSKFDQAVQDVYKRQRKNAVTGLDFEVIPFGDEPLDKEIADFIEEQLNGIESFEDVENDLLDAIGKGFAVSEILWGYDEGHVVVQDIKTRHQKRFFWDTLDDSFKVRTKDVPEGILLPANKFIVHRYKARSGHTSRAGILRVVAWMYLFKMCIRDSH